MLVFKGVVGFVVVVVVVEVLWWGRRTAEDIYSGAPTRVKSQSVTLMCNHIYAQSQRLCSCQEFRARMIFHEYIEMAQKQKYEINMTRPQFLVLSSNNPPPPLRNEEIYGSSD